MREVRKVLSLTSKEELKAWANAHLNSKKYGYLAKIILANLK